MGVGEKRREGGEGWGLVVEEKEWEARKGSERSRKDSESSHAPRELTAASEERERG